RQRRRKAARRLPRAPARGRQARGRHPLRLPAAARSLLRRPRRRPPRAPAAVLDARAGRRLALLLAVHRSPDREVHDRGPARAPASVLSSGAVRERAPLPDGRIRWHYALEFPQPAYLVTLVAGPFVEIAARAPRTGVDVFYFVPAGREADARRSFARTPEMIDFFSDRIGVPYPYPRYSQITVAEFIFGGMENTTATTLTDLVLLDERAALDHDVEGLVSHELAHQWWGDLLTCREWSEAWLNEGFATYFEYVWREHAKGRDEADVELLADAEGYLAEAGRYPRPVVCRPYDEPTHLC